MWELALPLAAVGSGAAWARLAARRAGEHGTAFTARALLGGAAAFGLALFGYDLVAFAGAEIRWEQLTAGGPGALAAAAGIGLVEEGAKLGGILLAAERVVRRGAVMAVAFGVAAAFASLEALIVFHGELSATALARTALGPLAHALLAVPLGLGVAAAIRRTSHPWLPLVPALLASAALHAAGDLSLALPGPGEIGYAATLAAPALVLFARAQRSTRAARLEARGVAALP
jgi:RsiW-degrading membrane proteinase PrsW (M82 family)